MAAAMTRPSDISGQIAEHCEPFQRIDEAALDGLMLRLADARLVLLGEASHGTAEFYDMRACITRRLIREHGFTVVAVEADWPDAAVVDAYVRRRDDVDPAGAFTRFPTWMWANRSVLDFVRWLRRHDDAAPAPAKAAFYGLDLYSMYASIEAVLAYLEDTDPEAAALGRRRYGCLLPWADDPAGYGRAALVARHRDCEGQVLAMLQDLASRRLDAVTRDGTRWFDAVQNARLIHSAERYYRSLYYAAESSWNLRDRHMFDTLQAVLEFSDRESGEPAKAVVWAHNSHLGDARATEMAAQGELNLGQLVRERYGDQAYLVGFGTHEGSVAAASDWGGPMAIEQVRPSLPGSYERLCHDAGVPRFLLPLRDAPAALRRALAERRLERAIGVIYRPETERLSHYFHAVLPEQFDEYVYFDRSQAVEPLDVATSGSGADTFPFGV